MADRFPFQEYLEAHRRKAEAEAGIGRKDWSDALVEIINAWTKAKQLGIEEKETRKTRQLGDLRRTIELGGEIPEPVKKKKSFLGLGLFPYEKRTDIYEEIPEETVRGARGYLEEIGKLTGKPKVGTLGLEIERQKAEAKRKEFDVINDLLKLKELTPEMIEFAEEYYPKAGKLTPFKREAVKEQALEYYQQGIPMPGLSIEETAKLAGLAEKELPPGAERTQQQKINKVIGSVRAEQGIGGLTGITYPIKTRDAAWIFSMQEFGLDPDKIPEIKAEIDKKFPLLSADDKEALDWVIKNPRDRKTKEIERYLSDKYPHLDLGIK